MLESRRITWPAYIVASAMIVLPLADVLTSLYPWRLLDARWRFGAVGLVSNSLLLPMAGLLLAFLTALFLEHVTARRIIGGIALLASTLCVLALVAFALDAVQTRAGVRAEMRSSFTVASIAAAIKTLIAAMVFLTIGLGALRRGRERMSKVKQSDVPLFGSDPASVRSARLSEPSK